MPCEGRAGIVSHDITRCPSGLADRHLPMCGEEWYTLPEMLERNTVSLFIAPHPDDETLACGGTIALKAERGEEVYIAFMTDGRDSHLHTLGIATDPSPEEMALIRKEEAVLAAGILGVGIESLFFFDLDSALVRSYDEEVLRTVGDLLVKLRPDEVYYPDRTDSHATHQATCYVVETCLSVAETAIREFRYVVWSDDATDAEGGRLEVDVTSALPLKKRAIEQYASQVTVFSKQQKQPLLSEAFLGRFLTGTEAFFI